MSFDKESHARVISWIEDKVREDQEFTSDFYAAICRVDPFLPPGEPWRFSPEAWRAWISLFYEKTDEPLIVPRRGGPDSDYPESVGMLMGRPVVLVVDGEIQPAQPMIDELRALAPVKGRDVSARDWVQLPSSVDGGVFWVRPRWITQVAIYHPREDAWNVYIRYLGQGDQELLAKFDNEKEAKLLASQLMVLSG